MEIQKKWLIIPLALLLILILLLLSGGVTAPDQDTKKIPSTLSIYTSITTSTTITDPADYTLVSTTTTTFSGHVKSSNGSIASTNSESSTILTVTSSTTTTTSYDESPRNSEETTSTTAQDADSTTTTTLPQVNNENEIYRSPSPTPQPTEIPEFQNVALPALFSIGGYLAIKFRRKR